MHIDGQKDEFLCPNFYKEIIDVIPEHSAHWLLSLHFRIKGKRQDDIVLFGLGQEGRPCDVSFYENPRNLEFDEGIQDESVLVRWNKLALQKLKQPSSCVCTDITGNGFSDLIMTCEYGKSPDAMDPYGGRICWLENFGTNEGDWSCHEIGRFPGVNSIKVGHFSTTYSLQLLAIVKASRRGVNSPLIIFTRPPDVYNSKYWLVATALENVFTSIRDCIIVPGSNGSLDDIVIASEEGLSIAWYRGRSWQYLPLRCVNSPLKHSPGKLCSGKIDRGAVSFLVSAEANHGAVLSIYRKDLVDGKHCEFRDIVWRYSVIEDFTDGQGASILDVLCGDFDGDGVDEIVVSVSSRGPNTGIYYFIHVEDCFVKYKLCDEAAMKITTGHFTLKNKLDLAMLSYSDPAKVMVLSNSFISSPIKPSVENSELVFSVPRIPKSICEIDVIDVAGYTISLVILPPDTSFDVPDDGSVAVKVLHGLLGWIDSQSEVIERTRAACLPGCVTPMLVDAPEGDVRSGDDGAVFVRMRLSQATDAAELRALNVLASYFPSSVRSVEFAWQPMEGNGHNTYADSTRQENLYHLDGFRVRFDDASNTSESSDISYVHFWAAASGTSTAFTRNVISSLSTGNSLNQGVSHRRGATACSIRASLSNPSGESGLLYCRDSLDWGSTPPTSLQIARAHKMVLPAMYEHGPFWRSVKVAGLYNDEEQAEEEVEYPWHSWTAGRGASRRREWMKWNIWMAFDFLPFQEPNAARREEPTCTIC